MSRPSVDQIIPVSLVLRYWGSLEKPCPNAPNLMKGHVKSNPKSSDHYFTSSETLL